MKLPLMFLYVIFIVRCFNFYFVWDNHLHVTGMQYVAMSVQRLDEHHRRLWLVMVSNILVVPFSLNS
jgi:hypothetical protein